MVRTACFFSLRGIAMAFAVAALIFGCSSAQQGDDELEMSDEESGDQSDMGNDDAAEGNGQEEVLEDSESSESNSDDSESTNNATGDDTASDSGEDTEATLSGNAGGQGSNSMAAAGDTGDTGAEDSAAMPAEPPMNSSAGGGAEMAAAAAPASGPSSPLPGGRVRYVREGGVQVTSAPGGGNPVFTLEQGDHPVTWDDGGAYKIGDGMYISPDSLSDDGIGRAKNPLGWR